MRILFLTSSLEPGRDGVGDYVRLLAGACMRLGHACAIVALNDSHVAATVDSVLETSDGPIPFARLPATADWSARIHRTIAFRNRFETDWLSFQIVPYAYEKRGLLRELIEPFHQLTRGYALHLMFHELWIGGGWPSPFRHRLTGWFQRRAIEKLIFKLRPSIVTTSNPVFVSMLRSLHVQTTVLPLFGNVPIEPGFDFERVSRLLVPTKITAKNRGDWWIGAFFGSLHPEWKPEPFMGHLTRAAERANKKICLLFIGRPGTSGDAMWKKMEADYASQAVFLNLGEQPTNTISALLQSADFGVAASPWQLIGKSGTAAAMLDHGLPVIVTRDDFQPYYQPDLPPSSDPLVYHIDEELETDLVAGLAKRPPAARVDTIAAQLCERFESLSLPTP